MEIQDENEVNTIFCDVDIMSPRSGKMVGQITHIAIQRACDQMESWLKEGYGVNVRVENNSSQLVLSPEEIAKRKKDADEIFSSVVLDIP